MKYSSLPKSHSDLTQNLISKGLLIEDIPIAERDLLMIGYFRFKRYSSRFQIADGRGDFSFIKNTYFEDIKDDYVFDSALRVIIFEAIADIEIAFKSILNYTMTLKYGTHWYLNSDVFTPKFSTSLDPNYLSNYDKFIQNLTKECAESNETFIKRYRQAFSDPSVPPSWFVMEIISFGTSSILYQNIKEADERTAVLNHFGTPQKIFETWLISLSYIRNQCAHHHKIMNRTFMFPPIIPQREKHRFLTDYDKIEQDGLYAVLCVIQRCLMQVNINSLFSGNLKDLINANSQIDLSNLGFVKGWEKESIWQ